MNDDFQHVYIDTCLLQDYLWGNEEEMDSARITLHSVVSSTNRHPHIVIKISFLVVGELVNNLIRSDQEKEDTMKRFIRFVENWGADIIPPSEKVQNKADELRKKDNKIEHIDSLLVCQALCDPYSSHFLTSDDILLTTHAISDLNREMNSSGQRKRDLKVTEEFGRL